MDEAAADRPADEVPEHLLGHLEVGDDAVAERPGRTDRRRGAPIMRRASAPTASTCPETSSMATTDGSRTTPWPRTKTTVFAVHRSTAISPPLRKTSGARAGKARWCADPFQRPSKAEGRCRDVQSVLVDDRVRHREFEAGERLLGRSDDPDAGVPTAARSTPSEERKPRPALELVAPVEVPRAPPSVSSGSTAGLCPRLATQAPCSARARARARSSVSSRRACSSVLNRG